jgi:DNA-directed RNA polymerase specialized sigma24 family protein
VRNAAIDQFRRRGAADRAYEAFARELETHDVPTDEMESEICACVSRLAATLKPEYAEALQAIDVGRTPVKAFAEQKGLSSSNAAVRAFRARDALKKRVTESCKFGSSSLERWNKPAWISVAGAVAIGLALLVVILHLTGASPTHH